MIQIDGFFYFKGTEENIEEGLQKTIYSELNTKSSWIKKLRKYYHQQHSHL